MNVHYAKFQKSLIVEQFQGNYLNSTSNVLKKDNFANKDHEFKDLEKMT